MLLTFSSFSISTLSISAPQVVDPRVGAIRSRDLATISSRVIGFSAVPRTASTCSVRREPSRRLRAFEYSDHTIQPALYVGPPQSSPALQPTLFDQLSKKTQTIRR